MAAVAISQPSRSNNGAKFEALVNSVRPRAMLTAFRLTGNRSDAEDLLQASLTKAWRAFETYTPDRSFLNWLLRIVQRTHIDAMRKRNRRGTELELDGAPVGEDGVGTLEIADRTRGPQELAEANWAREAVWDALNHLAPPMAEAIKLCDLDGLSYSEAAEIMGIQVGTVRSRLHRARKELRVLLRPTLETLDGAKRR